jgi:hypothetical protein
VRSGNGQISFRDAIDRAALILSADGFSITEVKQCVFVGGDQGGNTIFSGDRVGGGEQGWLMLTSSTWRGG